MSLQTVCPGPISVDKTESGELWCTNTPSASIILYLYPRDATLKRKREKQVLQTRADWKAETKYSSLYSEYFTDGRMYSRILTETNLLYKINTDISTAVSRSSSE